jgi:hypothetical protein
MSDDRMTWGLIVDVLDVLERHGYHKRDNRHVGQAVGMIAHLASVYDGTRDAGHGSHLDYAVPAPPPEPPAPRPDAGQHAVILTGTDISTVFAALDISADYKRDRAEMCTDCPDQSCPTCQTRLHDARAYDQLADRMLQATDAPLSGHRSQGESAGLSRQARLASDKEAGQ